MRSAPKPGVSPAQAIERARALLDTVPAAAELQAREVLKRLPDDVRALCVIGAARRRHGDFKAARKLLEELVAQRPDTPGAELELAYTMVALGEGDTGLDMARTTARRLGAEKFDWLAVEAEFALAGATEAAAQARAENFRGWIHDFDLLAAVDALRAGRARDAAVQLRGFNRAGTQAPALYVLAEAAWRLGHRDDAEAACEAAVALDPAMPGVRRFYAMLLLGKAKPHEALAQLAALAAAELGSTLLTAAAHFAAGDMAAAAAAVAGLLARYPGAPKLWLMRGQIARSLGQTADAARAFRQALAARPDLAEAHWCLSDIRGHAFDPAEVVNLRGLLGQAAQPPGNLIYLHHALGRALAQNGAWEDSFAQHAQAARIARAVCPYDARATSEMVAQIIARTTPEFFAASGAGGAAGAPIFIVGLPRSGSTLVEQILASHPAVEATQELPEMVHLVSKLGRPGRLGVGPDVWNRVAALTSRERGELGAAYLAGAGRYRRLGRSRFIDKSSENFWHIGLIRLILPAAKIIDARRHPMAAGLSIFTQHFSRGQTFSRDLAEIGAYYRDYRRLMAHFDTVLPGFVHRVIYEDLVVDSEAEIRRLLDFCGLDFDPGCARFWATERPVATHSAEQVRQPIFADSLNYWRHFEAWLEPIRTALGPALEKWR